MPLPSRFSVKEYIEGIKTCDRVMLSRAITLVESSLDSDRLIAEEVIQHILPLSGNSIRIGVTGIPGVGKSTFIEAFGKYLTSSGKKIAVLTIDPSSQKTKGSILGDKTRMDTLSKDENAFIRPTAAGSALGGVAENTREAMLLCEAAGFEIIIVETVGVGQSEAQVRSMVDFFLLLLIGGAGDELQGIKKGIMEMADGLVITKADGENLKRATQAQADYQHALHLFPPSESGWTPKVLLSSAIEQKGLKEIWRMVDDYKMFTTANGFFASQRIDQNKSWFYSSLGEKLIRETKKFDYIKERVTASEKKIISGELSPAKAAGDIVRDFLELLRKTKA